MLLKEGMHAKILTMDVASRTYLLATKNQGSTNHLGACYYNVYFAMAIS